MKFLILLSLVLLQFKNTFSSDSIPATTSYNILSLNSNSYISPYTQSFMQSGSFTNGMISSSTFSTNFIRGDMNLPVSALMVKYNGDIATDVLSFGDFYKDGNYMSKQDYYVNYTYSDSTLHSLQQKSTYNRKLADQYKIGCNYVAKVPKVNGKSSSDMSFTKIQSYSIATFAILKESLGIKLLTYLNDTLNYTQLDEYLDSNSVSYGFSQTNYTDIWVINQEYYDYSMLAVQDLQGSINFYNITNQDNRKISLSYFTSMKYSDYNSTSITKIGIYGENILIGTKDNGFMALTNIASTGLASSFVMWQNKFSLTLSNNKTVVVNDFVVNQKSIYLICEDLGMVILDLTNNFLIKSTYLHPSMTQIDFINNPYLGSKFVGVGLNNANNIYEFFIEFLIDDEFNPLVNKVFTSDSLVGYDSFKTTDLFYTYIFNKITQSIIIIRRGMINTIPSEFYNIYIGDLLAQNAFEYGYNPLITLYDFSNAYIFPAIVTNGLFLINSITMNYDNLICNFKDGGLYNVTMTLKGEVCAKSLNSGYLYTSCDKIINVSFMIYGDSSQEVIGIIAGVVCVCGFLFIGIIAFLVVKTRCCREFDEFLLTKDSNLLREDLYKEEQRVNFNKDSSNDNNQNEYQLGTMVDGKIYGNVVDKTPESNKADIISNENEIEELKKMNYNINEQNDKKDNYNVFDGQRNVTRTTFKKLNKGSNENIVKIEAENITVNAKKLSDISDNHSAEFKQVELVNVNENVKVEKEENLVADEIAN